MKGGIVIPKELTIFIDETFDHILSDIDVFEKTINGFHKAFNSTKNFNLNANKNEYQVFNIYQYLNINSPNKSLSMNATYPNFQKNLKINNEELFYITVFRILLGEKFESLVKINEQRTFKNWKNLDSEILEKIKKHNSMILQIMFKNFQN